MPPLNSISTKCSGQRPLWKKSPRSYNLPKPFETLKSENKFKKIGSKWTNQKVTKFPETSATLRSFVGFQIFVVKPLFTFLSSIGPFTKKGAILCSQLVLWLVNFVRSGSSGRTITLVAKLWGQFASRSSSRILHSKGSQRNWKSDLVYHRS